MRRFSAIALFLAAVATVSGTGAAAQAPRFEALLARGWVLTGETAEGAALACAEPRCGGPAVLDLLIQDNSRSRRYPSDQPMADAQFNAFFAAQAYVAHRVIDPARQPVELFLAGHSALEIVGLEKLSDKVGRCTPLILIVMTHRINYTLTSCAPDEEQARANARLLLSAVN
ncbi:MAG: hypothetical protein J0H01_34920 [Rhizobiales bacterium]|nr:hypothetical protein [Hyphomicrobiales bacterium]